jgi:predicted site-specific integrase-resolvase
MKKRAITPPHASVKVYDVSVRAAAERLDVSTETIKRWARANRIDARKNTSGNWMFSLADVEAMRDRNIVVEMLS